jgi:hypothetical protein
MKNKIIVLALSVLIIGMPLATAYEITTQESSKLQAIHGENHKLTFVQTMHRFMSNGIRPIRANGNFSGDWGFDIWGEVQIPVGWMSGYYRFSTKLGYFYAQFAYYGQNVSWYIQGHFFGPFMFGSLGENESANSTLFVGIGRYNDTYYHWRVMGEKGPTFFMEGQYGKFN